MTLDQLLVFQSIARLGSFSAAAKELHRAQSAVSTAIKNLEDEFGVVLFDRDQYRPALTRAGRVLLAEADALMEREQTFRRKALELGAGRETELRLAVDAICSFAAVEQVLHRFVAAFPDVALKLFMENLGGGLERLEAGEADLAVIETMSQPHGVELLPWSRVRFVPVAAPSHPLAHKKGDIVEDDTENVVQIIVKSSRRFNEAKDALVSRRSRAWVVGDFPTKRALLEEGFGWGFMPEHFVQEPLKAKRLCLLKIQEEFRRKLFDQPPGKPFDDTVALYVARRADAPHGPVARAMWALLGETSPSRR